MIGGASSLHIAVAIIKITEPQSSALLFFCLRFSGDARSENNLAV